MTLDRLLAINLYSYVVNPFTPEAYFDFELFKKHVGLAQRIMDDIIDLELEKIEKIMEKIDSDPESEEVKGTERHLWEKSLSQIRSRTPYRSRYYSRRRYACRYGIAATEQKRLPNFLKKYTKQSQ